VPITKMPMKLRILCWICFFPFSIFAQSPDELIKNTKTKEEANNVVKNYSSLEPKLFEISSEKDTSDITLPLFEKKPGYTFKIDNNLFKIIENKAFPEFRVSYIYLDGSQLTKISIDSIRAIILNKFKNGIPFYELAQEYSMDGNTTGDLGWFGENVMVKEFEVEIKNHKKNEIFTVDLAANKWYYVVFKTFDDRVVKRLTILKIRAGL
jgi:parvulin-like peptidyl-prolyl isomerase